MLFQIDIKLLEDTDFDELCLRVMLFQIDIKQLDMAFIQAFKFESNVILDRYKTSY